MRNYKIAQNISYDGDDDNESDFSTVDDSRDMDYDPSSSINDLSLDDVDTDSNVKVTSEINNTGRAINVSKIFYVMKISFKIFRTFFLTSNDLSSDS